MHHRVVNRRNPNLKVIAPNVWEILSLGWTNESLHDAQLKDPSIGPALAWLEAAKKPSWSGVESKPPMLRTLWTQFDSVAAE